MDNKLLKEILSKIVSELKFKDYVTASNKSFKEYGADIKKDSKATKEAIKPWEEIQELINQIKK